MMRARHVYLLLLFLLRGRRHLEERRDLFPIPSSGVQQRLYRQLCSIALAQS